MNETRRDEMHRRMFDLQVGYLHHRLTDEPWWGMDYGIANFTMLKVICGLEPDPPMDLDSHAWRGTLAECWTALTADDPGSSRDTFLHAMDRHFAERWLRAYPRFEEHLADNRWFGCFRYSLDEPTGQMDLHFGNRVEPDSPLEDMDARRSDLARIVDEIERTGSTPRTVRFDTWMNDLPPIIDLFGGSYAASLVECDEFPKGYGWWGQFVSRTGGFNDRRAARFRDGWQFPFRRRTGRYTWEEFRSSVTGR